MQLAYLRTILISSDSALLLNALLDERGNAAGTAKDYRSVIEPRDEWRFRALVLYSKAVSAKVSRISEEE